MTEEHELERLLARHAWSGEIPELPERVVAPVRRPPSPRPWLRPLTLAAVALGVASIGLLWLLTRMVEQVGEVAIEGRSYPVAYLEGGAGSQLRRIERGDTIATGTGERLEIEVGDIGRLFLEPGSRLTVAEPTGEGAKHQLRLDLGTARASIVAQPRAFQLETPAGVAVDLGCVYRTEVRVDGTARVAVESGRVAFERSGQRILVPAGAEVEVATGAVFVLPVWSDDGDAIRELCRQLARPAVSPTGLAAGLVQLEAAGARRGSLALFHLLDHPDQRVRLEAWRVLTRLVDPPVEATRERTLAGEASARRLWERRLPWPG
ncbi:FecR family protein [Engelhardtia mirabilis]|uniref:FecR protein n=1 Tax=Engelhardtia mirabilis TaxID=2528011 RepID=A0A518BIE8_9BACT|nr:FecR protein [Planctomycetes bacterium Pla133]QDV01083.1 FecR protein [Planctomycetes bacterium Pla86]